MKIMYHWNKVLALLLCTVMLVGNFSAVFASETVENEGEEIILGEEESYDKEGLWAEDTELGEDIGKKHDVTTSREYEPDITLGKSAKWDNIEEGLATLTLTERDTSDWSDNPSDYIIVLDRTRTMALDDSAFWSENTSAIGASHSVCLNEDHFYLLAGQPVKLIDYSNGMLMEDKTYFTVNGSSRELWKRHYNSSGTRIDPNLANGCLDRLTLAQKSIRDIMDVLDEQNKKELAGGLKNRVMYWSFSGPTYKDQDLHPDGLWDEIPQFTSDIAHVKHAVKYESYAGTYYNNSFEKILDEVQKKQSHKDYRNIPTKVIFISDGLQSDSDKNLTARMAQRIKEMPNTKLFTILIGNSANSDAGKLLKGYATDESCFATVNSSWNTFINTITAIQNDQFEIRASKKVLTDKINTDCWEVMGEPALDSGNGSAKLDEKRETLTWYIPEGEGTTYTCRLRLKLKDEYRYLLSDTSYPTNRDAQDAAEEEILKNPQLAGAVLEYEISGGKYSGEERNIGIKTPKLKYGTLEFSGEKHWSVAGSGAEELKIVLKRTMPGTQTVHEINNTFTNEAKNWKYHFQVRQMPDGRTYPLIKYNNTGEMIDYTVEEEMPEYYVQINKSEKVSGHTMISDFYNEPYKMKIQLEKIDEETKNPLKGAEFSVFSWSKKENDYVPYKGIKSAVTGADSIMKLKEETEGFYITPAWLYYSGDNEGKFRIVETKAPKGYFGDWKDEGKTSSDSDKNVYDFQISKESSRNGEIQKIEGKLENRRVKGIICFDKKDMETGTNHAQGEASLSGAEYKLYAAEDIVHQDGVTGLLYKKDEEIRVRAAANHNGQNVYTCDPEGTSRIQTGFSAEACITGLELGDYYLKEVSASEGYLADPAIYEISLNYEGEKVKVVEKEKTVFERVKKQSLSFYKLTGEDNADQLDPMRGAGFSVYLLSELENGRYENLSDEDAVQAVIDDLRNPETLLYDTCQKYEPAKASALSDDEDVLQKRLVKEVIYENGKSYTAEYENEYLVAELESDSKGVVKTPALPFGRYIVIETATPKGKTAARPFVVHVDSDAQDLMFEGDGQGTPLQDQQLTVLIDRPVMSLIRILKRDIHSKEIVLKEGAAYVIRDVEGAWFDYITNEMTTAQKRAYKAKYGNLVAQYSQGTYFGTGENPFVTKIMENEDGTEEVFVETPVPLPNGTYELEEIRAPEGYILQGHEGVIGKKKNGSGNGTFYETELSGMWDPAPQGKTRFVVSGIEAVYDEAAGNFVVTVRQDNEPAVGKISIYAEGEKLVSAAKEKNTDDYQFVYGMQPVAGAKFEIRAAEDIYSQEGGAHGKKIFGKNELIMVLTTDEKGQTWTGQEDWEGTDTAKGLPLGKYHVIQTVAGDGYYLSEENCLPREVNITYAGQEVPVIYRDLKYTNPRQTVKIEVMKTDAETGEQLSAAVFGLYAKEDIKNYKNKTVVKEGTLLAIAQTPSSEENAVFKADLPFGRYFVKELKAPAGYAVNTKEFEVNAVDAGQENETVKAEIRIENERTKHLFLKSDILSGEMLSGAEFEIWEIMTDEQGKLLKNEDGSYKVAKMPSAAWTSKKEGNLVEGLTAGKQYILRENQAPYGYAGYEASDSETKNANREVNTIEEEMMFIVPDTAEIVTHHIKNQRVTGTLILTKEGEFLTDAYISPGDQLKNLFKTIFETVLGRVENVTFDVYVKEDIFSPDGSGAYAWWKDRDGNVFELKAGTKIAAIRTDHNGRAVLENLPLGIYFVKEVNTGSGQEHLVSKEIKEAEFCYKDQNTPVVGAKNVKELDIDGIGYINERQKVSVSLRKYEISPAEKRRPVSGAVFGIFTAEDIYGYKIDEEKNIREYLTTLIKAHTLIETAESDKDGRVQFSENLPCGKYYVQEISPAAGYFNSSLKQYFDASYTGEKGEPVLKFELEAVNKLSKVSFRKTDLQTGKDLAGAKLQIIEKESGSLVTEWTSDGKVKEISGLKLSDKEEYRYVFREISPVPGYATAEDIEFKLVQKKDSGGSYTEQLEVYIRNKENWILQDGTEIEMKDDVTKVEIRKIDKERKTLIYGARLELRDSEGKTAASWISSDKEAFYVEKLPAGSYTIVETESPKGYKKADPLRILIDDTVNKQIFYFENEPAPEEYENQQNPPDTGERPVTGDGASLCLWIGLLGISGAGITVLKGKKLKK